jgi:hypothetical protein
MNGPGRGPKQNKHQGVAELLRTSSGLLNRKDGGCHYFPHQLSLEDGGILRRTEKERLD